MSLKHTIELVIKAQDEASKKVKEVENQIKKFSTSSKTSMNQTSQATQKVHQELQKTGQQLEKVSDDYLKVGTEGNKAFNQLTKEQQKAVVQFHKISDEAQTTIIAARECGEAIGTIGKGWAINQFKNATVDTKTWAGSLDYAKTKLDLLGTNTESLKGKIQVAGTAIQTYLGSKWDTVTSKMSGFKSRITGLGSIIKNSLGNALSNVATRLQRLGQAFDGIGGMISSSIGMTGVGSIKELTIGLSLSREKMSSLNTAIMGSADASKTLLDSIDTMTNSSVVGMDQMVNALNKIKLSTQMSNEELSSTKEVVMKLGEASMLMGNDTETAAYQMGEAFSGLNGDFQILKENFGITKEKMKEMGWSGEASDVDGYTKALEKCLEGLGDLGGVMDTNSGKIAQVQKKFRTAGRTLGDMLTPYIGQAADAFLKLEDRFPGIAQGLIGVAGGISIFATVAPTLTPMIGTFKEVKSAIKDSAVFLGILTGEEDALTLATSMNTISQKLNTISKSEGAIAATEEAIANGGLTASFSALATSIWAATAPLLPYVAAIAAVGIAIYELGKYFGWWTDVGSMIDAVTAGLSRLWSAFINNPDVQGFLKGLGDAWNWIVQSISPAIGAVMDFFGVTVKSEGEFDIVRTIIDGVGAAFHQVADQVRFTIGVFQTIYGVFQGIASFLAPYGQMIYDFLKPIVCILLGCSPGIVPALEKVQEVFQTVWSFIAGFIGSYVSTVVSVIGTVVTTVQSIVNVFAQLLTGQISLSEAIPMIWNLISNAFVTIGGTILSFITKWAGQLLTLAIRAATNFMNGIVNRIRNLPGKVYGFITSTASRIASGAVNWANNARNAATNTVNSVVNNIQGLPGKVYTEFFNIGGKIGEAASHVIQKAADFANGVKNKVLDILGIHSPGILQEKIGIEFQDISTRSIGEKAKLAYENAKTFASNIISGFESEDMSSLEVMTPEIASNTPTMPLASTVTPQLEAPDTKAITDTVTTAYDTMNNLVGTDLQNLQYMNTQSFNNISLNEETMMKKIYSHVNSTLSTILKTNKTSLNQNTNTTKTQLSKMRNSTTTVTGQMVKAWNSMRTSIVSAARKIDSDATAHFNTLGKTIGGFYGKLQNPSRWGTGPGPKEERRGTGRGSRLVSNGHSMRVMSSRLANATMRENHMPRTITVRSVQNNPVLKGFTDFISDGSNIDVRTLFETGVLSPFNLGGLSRASFGAWENTAKPNIDKIKKTARNWSMKGPRLANRVSSGLTFHLKDFENGTPRIGMNDFINMAYALVNSTSYGYYANSERYGSWLNALNHGVMNCSDGSDMLIALARTCGLPASKVHCYWGTNSSGIAGVAGKGEGHFVARIGGRIMDSVSMRHGSLTSPKVHGYGTGPSPFKSISETNRNSDNHDYASSEDIKMDIGDFTITHKFEGLPDGVDEATIARMINDAPNNERFVKQLANNVKFQIADHRAKVRFERKGNRSKGLGA